MAPAVLAEFVLNGLVLGALYVVMALGLSIIFGMIGIINFAHGALFTLGAYAAFQVKDALGFPATLVVSPLLVGVLGMLIEATLLRRLQGEGPPGFPGDARRLAPARGRPGHAHRGAAPAPPLSPGSAPGAPAHLRAHDGPRAGDSHRVGTQPQAVRRAARLCRRPEPRPAHLLQVPELHPARGRGPDRRAHAVPPEDAGRHDRPRGEP